MTHPSGPPPGPGRAETTLRRVVLGIGASLGDRHRWLRGAVAAVAAWTDTQVVRVSRPVWSRGVGPHAGPFLNGAVLLRTRRTPAELLRGCKAVEARLGRRPSRRWGARAIDVDILVIEGLRVDRPELVVPHRHLLERPFALGPAAEVAPDLVVPGVGRALSEVRRRATLQTWTGRGALARLAGRPLVR